MKKLSDLWSRHAVGEETSSSIFTLNHKRTAFLPRIISNLTLYQELSEILGQELKITAKRNWTDWFSEDLTEFFTLIRFIQPKRGLI
jgi:hypothetical protein